MLKDAFRGTGRTTSQIRSAPVGAIYIWPNSHLAYPRKIAEQVGRDDLRFVSPGWLTAGRWQGLNLTGLVKDHAVHFNEDEWQAYHNALTMVRR